MTWTLVFIIKSQPKEALIAIGIIVAGTLAYLGAKKYDASKT
jgi:hypothetical protein